MSAGRPTAYRDTYPAEALRQSLLGATDEQLAGYFGVRRSTISAWKLRYSDFSDALKKGKGTADGIVAGALFGRARGAEWIEEQAVKVKRVQYADGKRVLEEERVEIVKVRRSAPPDTTACIFWLKNRRPDAWRDRTEVGIDRLDALTDAELESIAAGKIPKGA